jgi:hypothetical protein
LKIPFKKLAGLFVLGIALFETTVIAYERLGLRQASYWSRVSEFVDRPSVLVAQELDHNGYYAVMTLSHMAQGLVNYAIAHPEKKARAIVLLDKIAQHAISGDRLVYMSRISALYKAHYIIILTAHDYLAGDHKYQTRRLELSKALAQRLLKEPTGNTPSMDNSTYRFPADTAVDLYALWLQDKLQGTHLSREPISRWLAYMSKQGTDASTGLFISEVTGQAVYAKYPRGCANSLIVRLLADMDKPKSKLYWKSYNHSSLVDFALFIGYREYPLAVNLAADSDSGPIFLGAGAAATGFAIGAARRQGDSFAYFRLMNILSVIEVAARFAPNKAIRHLAAEPLALGILFDQTTQTRWP